MPDTIFIVTPCLNARDTIDRTILSVVTQAGDFRIRYHIQDGGSTDGTVERLHWWQQQLGGDAIPVQCGGIAFTFSAEPDAGMYDAVLKGFARLAPGDNDFMTWINADDVLMVGALSLIATVQKQFTAPEISWIGGGAAILRDDYTVVSVDRQAATEVIQLGLCEGIHWTFVQQEGTFFRKWLWSAVDPVAAIGGMKLAGDWNLWRLFAGKANFVQYPIPLGGFRLRKDQLSALHRDKYLAEIDAMVSREERRKRLGELASRGRLVRRRLLAGFASDRLSVREESLGGSLALHYRTVFKAPMPAAPAPVADRILFEGRKPDPARETEPAPARIVRPAPSALQDNVYVYDHDWQFPAITEQHAFHKIRDTGGAPEGMLYVAYPWATLIDKIQSKARDAQDHLDIFENFCRFVPRHVPKVTVCQHIALRNYLDLFARCGIEDIFWSHATKLDRANLASSTLRIHPLPLYPVQVPEEIPDAEAFQRPYLFSFIGAKPNDWYMTKSREWIIEELAADPRGLIIGRSGWHYGKIVYGHQIRPDLSKADPKDLVDQSASDEFKTSLTSSIFALCPSGSGPNSIRLWESIGAGAIPVILSDQYDPPGNPKLWRAAAVFCDETPEAIRALPDRLNAIARDPARLAQMRHAMRQIWMLYGPSTFVYDIQTWMLAGSVAAVSAGAAAVSGSPALDRLVQPIGDMGRKEASRFLSTCAGELLLDTGTALGRISGTTTAGQAVARARALLPGSDPVLQHFDRVLAHVSARATANTPAAPQIATGRLPAICFLGRHSHRTPLGYLPLRRVAGERVRVVEDPAAADLILTGFNIDLRENAKTFAGIVQARPQTRVAVISEEPLWDTIWSGGFTERDRTAVCDGIEVRYRVLSHQTSKIFDFERIPYFLLTSDEFIPRYRNLLAAQAGTGAGELLDRWTKAPIAAAFFAEVRDDAAYAKAFPEHDIQGLSVYRTRVARAVRGQTVLRVGKGWTDAAPRQDLPDWHLDKLVTLNRRARIVSAYENTHQRCYISEKIFDAFALGGIATYFASPGHRIFDLVPETAMLNTFGQTEADAAERLAGFAPDPAFAEGYLDAQSRLRRLLDDTATVVAERRRVVDEVLREIEALL